MLISTINYLLIKIDYGCILGYGAKAFSSENLYLNALTCSGAA